MEKLTEIYMDIVVETPLTYDEFYNKFVEFIENLNSQFGGGTGLLNENGNKLDFEGNIIE